MAIYKFLNLLIYYLIVDFKLEGDRMQFELIYFPRELELINIQILFMIFLIIFLNLTERAYTRGDFLGGTIQVVPHLTTEIKERFKKLAQSSEAEVVIIEVGGTVGDIEGQPFLEAIRQMRNDVGRENVLYIHVTLLPYLTSTQELKTKPTQHSVNELRRIGIQPDIIICRSDYPISEGIRDKISLF